MKVDQEEIKLFVKQIVEGMKEGTNGVTLTEPIEVEIQFITEKIGEGGIKAQIFNAGGKYSSSDTHKIKFSFLP